MARKVPPGELNEKQDLFCREYIIDLNGTQAAKRAGYSGDGDVLSVTASDLLALPKVQVRVNVLMERRRKRLDIDADYVLSTIQDTIEKCSQAVPVLDSKGIFTGEFKFEHSGVLKGLEMLGKNLKLFTERVEHSGVVTLEQLVAGGSEEPKKSS